MIILGFSQQSVGFYNFKPIFLFNQKFPCEEGGGGGGFQFPVCNLELRLSHYTLQVSINNLLINLNQLESQPIHFISFIMEEFQDENLKLLNNFF